MPPRRPRGLLRNPRGSRAGLIFAAATLMATAIGAAEPPTEGDGESASRLTDEAIPLQVDAVPERPKPPLELGEPFLGTGTLRPGFRLPTGAVWQPALVAFGSLRTAAQSFDSGAGRVSELVARLDLFANLQLSGTERVVVGFRPLDRDGRFTSYVFSSDVPGIEDGSRDEWNGEVTSVYFEGDFGEIFPNLSKDDFSRTDVGFSAGRQPLIFQEGMLINDSIDGIGLTRNTLQPGNLSNFRATLFLGFDEVGRPDRIDDDARLVALLTSTDTRRSTWDVDLAWVESQVEGDLLAGGISAIQRLGHYNTAFRLLGSSALDRESDLVSDGWLLLNEVSWTPHHSHDLVYVNTFVAADRFSSAARGPSTGGPLGRAGINFAAVGLGNYGAALSSEAEDVAGAAVGYQRFFDHTRKQLLVEAGARLGTRSGSADSAAVTVRFQTALKRHYVLVLDAFGGYRDPGPAAPGGRQELLGARVELVTKF